MSKAPYAVEYAKSGRSSCKSCKAALAQGQMRFGKLEQAEKWDGEYYVWNHERCFFSKYAHLVTKPEDISGLSELRWEDQDAIRKRHFPNAVVAPAAAAGGATASTAATTTTAMAVDDDGDDGVNDETEWTVELAKSGRSSCRGCGKLIANATLRIGQVDSNEEYGGSATRWFHVECYTVPVQLSDTSQLTGFGKLKAADKDALRKRLADAEEANAKRLKARQAQKAAAEKATGEVAAAVKRLWQQRDALRKKYSTSELKRMLRENRQSDKGGAEDLIARCADGVLNGAMPPCPECKGHLKQQDGKFVCTGVISAWSSCVYAVEHVDRLPWRIPDWSEDELETEEKKKADAKKKRGRKDDDEEEEAAEEAEEEEEEADEAEGAFAGLVVAFVGRFDNKPALIEKLEEGGAEVLGSVSKRVQHVIASDAERTADAKSRSLTNAEKQGAEIHAPDWVQERIDDYEKGASGREAARKRKSDERDAAKASKAAAAAAAAPSKSKAGGEAPPKRVRKGVVKVDDKCEVRSTVHVLDDDVDTYAATLNMADLNVGSKGLNSLYVLQVLEHSNHKKWYLFTRWGRIGQEGGTKLEDFSSKAAAVREFEKKFEEKTGNEWDQRHNFEKKPRRFYPIEIEYEEPEPKAASATTTTTTTTTVATTSSRLDARVKDLVNLIFDMKMFQQTMKEMDIDVKKLPLGRLSKTQIQQGYDVLEQLKTELAKPTDQVKASTLRDLTNQYYTKIPHAFGASTPPIIDSRELLQKKIEDLQVMDDIEVAQQLLQKEEAAAAADDENDPFVVKYRLLQNKIVPVPRDSDDYRLIEGYLNNTCENNPRLKLLDVFTVDREGEAQRFSDSCKAMANPNYQLLWHGSRVAVFAAILSTGLKIMPHSGGRVGKGLYFADIVSKSAGYCGVFGGDNIGLMLLNTVALGRQHRITRDDPSLVRPPAGYDSVHAVGTRHPDPAVNHSHVSLDPSGHPVVVPHGKIKQSGVSSSFQHDELLVYDAARVKMSFLLKVKWEY